MGFFENFILRTIKKHIKKSRKAVSEKQRATTSRKTMRKQDVADGIITQAKEQSRQLLKIVKDCAELVNTTSNPDVFFNRYNLMLEHLETLAGLECTGIYANSPELPSKAFLRIEEQFDTETNKFLDRSFETAKKHADTLKTDNGKRNAIKRYFDNMEKYIIYMSSESLEYFDKMKKENEITTT